MTPMRSQPITEDIWTEAEAMRLVRGLSGALRRHTRPPADPAELRHNVLQRTVEDEVIPRLLMARRPQKAARARAEAAHPSSEQVSHLVSLVLDADQAKATAYVEAMQDCGVSVESLFLELLTPAARQLGEMWKEDTCTFSDVTMGVMRLGNVMRLLSRAFGGDYEPGLSLPSILLVQMPGEQHGFGLAMVAQFFRQAAWNVRQSPMATSSDLVALVREHWFGIIGISVACSDRLETLAADIAAIRKNSRNRAIGVMVGGPPFLSHPQLAAMVGADATALDGRQAVRQALSLVSLQAREQ